MQRQLSSLLETTSSPSQCTTRSGLARAARTWLWQQLEAHSRPIAYGYFLEPGSASVVANGPGDYSIEVPLDGRDRMRARQPFLGRSRAPCARPGS